MPLLWQNAFAKPSASLLTCNAFKICSCVEPFLLCVVSLESQGRLALLLIPPQSLSCIRCLLFLFWLRKRFDMFAPKSNFVLEIQQVQYSFAVHASILD